jgi:hypothetical protein
MTEATPRFALPFILPGQAQKELFHNEALTRIDVGLHPVAEEALAAPPAAPTEGQCWLVETGATGAWGGKDDQIAMWTGSGWRFLAPTEAMSVWIRQLGYPVRWDGGGWGGGEIACTGIRIGGQQIVGERQPAVASPSGGTIIDQEARAGLDAIIAALMSHGLID